MLNRWITGLKKTHDTFFGKIGGLLGHNTALDKSFYEGLEELLITSDFGASTTFLLLDQLKALVKEQKIKTPEEAIGALRSLIGGLLTKNRGLLRLNDEGLSIYMFIGVNGVGKTTTIAKMAHLLKSRGAKVMLAAGDTFRAGAIEQIKHWGETLDVPVIAQQEGSDPAAVIYDAIEAAKARDIDVLLIDTAGRLHNKKNLMEEMKKIDRVIEREDGRRPEEILLIIDAGTGQNAVTSAGEFQKSIPGITGIILTKLDGTAKGGIVVPLIHELDFPIKYVGVGEGLKDLEAFTPEDFLEGIFGGGNA